MAQEGAKGSRILLLKPALHRLLLPKTENCTRKNSKILTYLFLKFLITLNLDHLYHLLRFLKVLTILFLENLHLPSNKKFLVRSCIHTGLSWFRTKLLGSFLSSPLGGSLSDIAHIILGGHCLETRTKAALPCRERGEEPNCFVP